MPTIWKRNNKWQAQVRKKGTLPISKTFIKRSGALSWTTAVEADFERAQWFHYTQHNGLPSLKCWIGTHGEINVFVEDPTNLYAKSALTVCLWFQHDSKWRKLDDTVPLSKQLGSQILHLCPLPSWKNGRGQRKYKALGGEVRERVGRLVRSSIGVLLMSATRKINADLEAEKAAKLAMYRPFDEVGGEDSLSLDIMLYSSPALRRPSARRSASAAFWNGLNSLINETDSGSAI